MVIFEVRATAFPGLMLLPDRGRALVRAGNRLGAECDGGVIPELQNMCADGRNAFSVRRVPMRDGTVVELFASAAVINLGDYYALVRCKWRKGVYLLEMYKAGSGYGPLEPLRKAA